MTEDLPFLLWEQARNRVQEHQTDHEPDTGGDPAADEDRLQPGPGQIDQEGRRLRHAAEMAETAYRLAEADGAPDS